MTTIKIIAESVRKFGYLRNRDIAALHLADDLRKTQRLTKKAVSTGALAERKTSTGSRFSCPDNAALLETVTGHRDAANAVLIDALVTRIATSVITDRQIQLNQSGYTLAGKIPDGLILDEFFEDSALRTDYTWLEVENSERSGRDVAVLGDWLMHQFMSTQNWHVLPDYRAGFLSKVIVAISSPKAEKIQVRLMSYLIRNYNTPRHVEFIKEILPVRLQFIEVY